MRNAKSWRVALAIASFSLASFGAVSTTPISSDVAAANLLKRVQSTPLRSVEALAVSNAMVDFGLTVHAAQQRAQTNVTTSPFSLMSAFGLAVNGAQGSTLTQMQTALDLKGTTIEQLNTGYQSLRTDLAGISRDNVLSFGNAIFSDRDFVVRDAFRDTVQRNYGADAESVNFSDPAAAADQINSYVAKQTQDMIQKMVDASSVQGWRTALVNAGYFKGAWAFNFDVAHTVEDAKFESGRDEKTVPLMYQYNRVYLYHQGDGFQMASLSYKNADFAMDVIVPDVRSGEDSIASLGRVQSQFTGPNYRSWIASSVPTSITLALPRFETDYKQDMSTYFQGVMPLAFSDGADFSLLSPEPIKLDKVIHATVLKVNEEGTEGAFATVVGGIRATSFPPRVSPKVIANHPFILVIRHAATGAPIFVSTVWDPKPLARSAN
jgi:serpin B